MIRRRKVYDKDGHYEQRGNPDLASRGISPSPAELPSSLRIYSRSDNNAQCFRAPLEAMIGNIENPSLLNLVSNKIAIYCLAEFEKDLLKTTLKSLKQSTQGSNSRLIQAERRNLRTPFYCGDNILVPRTQQSRPNYPRFGSFTQYGLRKRNRTGPNPEQLFQRRRIQPTQFRSSRGQQISSNGKNLSRGGKIIS